MGSGALCLGCILRMDSPAPAVLARRGMGAGRASPRLCRATKARRILLGSDTLCLGCNWRKDSPAPAVLARRGRACRLSLRRGSVRGFNPPHKEVSYEKRNRLFPA